MMMLFREEMIRMNKKRKKVLLLDVDGVLLDTNSWMAEAVGKPGHEFRCYDFATSLGIAEYQVIDAAREAVRGPGGPLPYEGALAFVRWAQERFEVFAVTAPWYSVTGWMDERAWCLSHELGIEHSHQIHTSAKHLVRGDYLVDDKGSNLTKWKAHNLSGLPLQPVRPGNDTDSLTGVVTYRSFDQLAHILIEEEGRHHEKTKSIRN